MEMEAAAAAGCSWFTRCWRVWRRSDAGISGWRTQCSAGYGGLQIVMAIPCRVLYWFTMGLKSRLSNTQSLNPRVFNQGGMSVSSEKMEAFHLLHQATPYIAFGFMAANDAVVRAGKGKGNENDSIHIIDLGMEHCLQWPPLIRTLAQPPKGPPKKVRITGLVKSGVTGLEPAMKELAEYAVAMGFRWS